MERKCTGCGRTNQPMYASQKVWGAMFCIDWETCKAVAYAARRAAEAR